MLDVKGDMDNCKISAIIPTSCRPKQISQTLENLGQQTVLPFEIIIVDGSKETITEEIIRNMSLTLPFQCHYIRHGGGTAIQRNIGIDKAIGNFIAFIDDDILLEPDFFDKIIEVFMKDRNFHIGGITGYITNQYLDVNTSSRWRWYRCLHLFTTYEPGRYDFKTGYPINRYLQPPHSGIKEIDFMGAGCAVWRSKVFEGGLRFSEFFKGYGILEDAHFALRAARQWKLLECGQARCAHLRSQIAKESKRQVARKTVLNYRYVFIDIIHNKTWRHEFRFWRVQIFDLFRFIINALRSGSKNNWLTVLGKLEGIMTAWRIRPGLDKGKTTKPHKIFHLEKQAQPLAENIRSSCVAEPFTHWSEWQIPSHLRNAVEFARTNAPDEEIVIGHIDNDGRVLGLFGELPGFKNISPDNFVKRYRYLLNIVLIRDNLLIRKDFCGDRDSFIREWHSLIALYGRANVPAVYKVGRDRCLIYKNFILGRTVRDILVEAGARILSVDIANDPELVGLNYECRIEAIWARGKRCVRSFFPEKFFLGLENQLNKIHMHGITGVSLTFGNVILNRDGMPWFIDFDQTIIHSSALSPLFIYRRNQDRIKFNKMYGCT